MQGVMVGALVEGVPPLYRFLAPVAVRAQHAREAAFAAFVERGVHVTLLERAPRFMPRALDAVASDLLAARLRKAGVDVVMGEEVARAEMAPNGAVGALLTNSGRRIAGGPGQLKFAHCA